MCEHLGGHERQRASHADVRPSGIATCAAVARALAKAQVADFDYGRVDVAYVAQQVVSLKVQMECVARVQEVHAARCLQRQRRAHAAAAQPCRVQRPQALTQAPAGHILEHQRCTARVRDHAV
eukprot:362982-Chlamydomonas_euryale.AAC.8